MTSVFRTTAVCTLLLVPAGARADVLWGGYAENPQHTALSSVASQPLGAVHWSTPVDDALHNTSGDLLIHYGSPVITSANTVIVPVRNTDGSFRLDAHRGSDGSVVWSQGTDYTLPPHHWVPSYSPALTATDRVYFAGAGGTVYFRDNVNSAVPTATGQIAFFGNAAYNANPSAFNGSVEINTPITADRLGNLYFGFQVTGANPLSLQSGIARISAAGVGTYTFISSASGGDASKVVTNCAPALSNDGSTVYVAVNSGNFTGGDLLALNSTTLATQSKVRLKDPQSGNDSFLPDDGTASPTVGPNGDVFFGVLENTNTYASKGWLLHFSADLTQTPAQKTPGLFGWDDTASIVPSSMVPSYTGPSSYLLMTKYNNYKDFGLDGVNKLAILDPNVAASAPDPRTGVVGMKEILTIAGVTPDGPPAGAVREWCINTAVVDPATDSVLANSEDGKLYRWDLATNSFTQVITLTPGVGEAYTPTVIGADGTVYAINDAVLFAVGASVPEPGTLGLGLLGTAGLAAVLRRGRRPLTGSQRVVGTP